MRQLSGALRGTTGLELNAGTGVEVYATPGLSIAVLHHTSPAPGARALLEAYRQSGLPAIQRRAGDCAVVLFDEASQTLVLARDFFGMTPWYHAANDAGFAFGTRVDDVVKSLNLSVAPDHTALACLLVYHDGAPPTHTFFEGVSSVPPGHVLVKRGDVVNVLPPQFTMPDEQRWSFPDAVAEFRHLMQQAVRRSVPRDGLSSVFVSGGLDSAALLCLAARDVDVIGINYGVTSDAAADETRYLEALRRSGLRIEAVPFFPTIDVASAERSVRESEFPVVEMVPLTLSRAAGRARELMATNLLMGIWGDQVLSPFPPAHHRALGPWHHDRLARAYHQYMTDVPMSQIRRALRRQSLRRNAPQWLLQRRRERLRKRTIFDGLAQSVAAFGPVERIRNYREAVARNVFAPAAQQGIETTTKWGNANGVDARLPFLDRELVQFLLTLPDEIAYHGNALKPLLRESMKGIVPDEVLRRRDKGDYTAVMRKQTLPAASVLDMLDGLRRPVALGLMSARSARKTLARIGKNSDIWNRPGVMAQLLGLDVWLRLFFEK